MARIGIMTFLHNENYGSLLQAWALKETLNTLGHDAIHIDYVPSRTEKLLNLIRSGNSPRLVIEGMRKRKVKSTRFGAQAKSNALATFRKEQLRISAPCDDRTALTRIAVEFDILLAGSDQIWSPVWLNPAYFLPFAGRVPRIAYAPSLGVKIVPSAKKCKKIGTYLQPFVAVSVREKEGARVLKQITGQDYPVMPDPVCLLPRETWQTMAKEIPSKGAYIACYFIGSNPLYWTKVAKLRMRTGLRVVVIPVTEEAYRQPYDMADGLDPQSFVGVLSGAEHIVTDSFHGTVFGAILGRPVTILQRDAIDDPESKNSRIENLLRELGCDRQDELLPSPRVDAALERMRQRGRDFLTNAVNQAMQTAEQEAAK